MANSGFLFLFNIFFPEVRLLVSLLFAALVCHLRPKQHNVNFKDCLYKEVLPYNREIDLLAFIVMTDTQCIYVFLFFLLFLLYFRMV